MKKYFNSIFVFIVLFVFFQLLLQSYQNKKIDEKIKILEKTGNKISLDIEKNINTIVSAVTMNEILLKNNNYETKNFNDWAKLILESSKIINNVQLAPNGIVQNIYPLKGNEKAIGHNLLKDSNRKIAALKAIETGKITFIGPIKLIQNNKLALIIRKPIAKTLGDKDSFWGFSTILVMIDDLLEENIFDLKNMNFNYAIYGNNPDSKVAPLIVSTNFDNENLIKEFKINVPNGSWLLKIQDPNKNSFSNFAEHFIVFALALIITLLIHIFLINRQRNQEKKEYELLLNLESVNTMLESQTFELEKALIEKENISLALMDGERISKLGSWQYFIEKNSQIWSEGMYQIFNVDSKYGPLDFDELSKYFTTDSWKKLENHINKAIKKGIAYECQLELIDKKGLKKSIISKGEPFFNENNKQIGIRGIIQDITEKVKSEEKRKKLLKQFERANKVAKLGTWHYDIRNDVLTWDKRVYEIFNIDKNEDKIEKIEDFFQFVDNEYIELVSKTYEEHLKTKNPYDIIHKVILKNSEIKYLRERCDTDFDGEEATFSHGIVQDVTNDVLAKEDREYNKKLEKEIIAKEEAIKEAKKLASIKSDFLSNMSHEIRTPLNGIVGITDIMLSEETSLEHKKYLQIIKNSSNVLKNVINDILDLSKIESGKFEIVDRDFDIYDLLNDVKQLFEPQIISKKLDFKINIANDINSYLIGDNLRISQVLSNLLSNAVKFTSKGHITLNILLLEKDKNNIKLRFEVVDTGIGISNSIKEKMFETFTQGQLSNTKEYQGTGLGLSICKGLVENMNGKIDYESTEGEGSKFFFDITFKYKSESKIIFDNLSSSLVLKESKKVLIAEDLDINQTIIKSLMNKLGFKIDFANNGEDAVELANKNNYDLILMDLQMPIMNGYEATKKIREFDKDTPIIALSAAVMPEDIVNSLNAGMNEHIGKPINRTDLVKVLIQYFPMEEKEDYQIINSSDLKFKTFDYQKILKNRSEKDANNILKEFANSYKNFKVSDNKSFEDLVNIASILGFDNLIKLTTKIANEDSDKYKIILENRVKEIVEEILKNIL